MNVRQKIGLAIITPLFVIAAGHTVINKINMDKKVSNTEVLPDITDTLNMKSKEAAAVFKAEQNLLNDFKKGNSTIKDIPIDKLSTDTNQH